MERYRADLRYQNVVRQDLAPLWKRAVAAPGWVGGRPIAFEDIVDELPLMERQHPLPPAGALMGDYVRRVVRTVSLTMGITSEGQSATWALRAVHDDATGQPGRGRLLSVSPRTQDDDLALTLDLTPNYVGVRYFVGVDGTHDLQDQEYDLSKLGFGYGEEHWNTLETIAAGIVVEAISVMRRGIEDRHRARNPTHIAKWEGDLDLLFRALFLRDRSLNPAETKRLRRLAEELGIDPPGRRSGRGPLPGVPDAGDPSDLEVTG